MPGDQLNRARRRRYWEKQPASYDQRMRIPDEQAAVREMTQMLRPGGLLLLADHIAGAA